MKMDMQKHVIDMLRSAKTVFVAQDKDGNGLAIDPDDALGLIDSLQQQQLAERDRTIARQSAALETATDALNGITNGEWVETIDDQFLEVWTTRRINPSRIADEALFAIGRELEALGE